MKIDSQTIDKMAHLSRLKVLDSERAEISKNLEQILSWMEKLNELDTDSVSPLVHMSAEINSLREDIAAPPIPIDQALKNAPSKKDHFIIVPKVIDL